LIDFIASFRKFYDKEALLKTKYFPNANQVIDTLLEMGDTIATNKREEPTHRLIRHYGWGKKFEWVAY